MKYSPLNSANSLGFINLNISYNESKAVYINEPCLYSLIMHSNGPFVEEF